MRFVIVGEIPSNCLLLSESYLFLFLVTQQKSIRINSHGFRINIFEFLSLEMLKSAHSSTGVYELNFPRRIKSKFANNLLNMKCKSTQVQLKLSKNFTIKLQGFDCKGFDYARTEESCE